jgi:carbon storage regulator
MLVITRNVSESIRIGNQIEVKILEIQGTRVRLGIVAPKEIPVYRNEIYLKIQRESKSEE